MSKIWTTLIVLAVSMGFQSARAQGAYSSSLSPSEEPYTVEMPVGGFDSRVHITAGHTAYEVIYRDRGPSRLSEVGGTLEVVGDKRYRFHHARYGPPATELFTKDEGETYDVTKGYERYPFVFKIHVKSIKEGRAYLRLLIHPGEQVPACDTVPMPLTLGFRDTSYLMCRGVDGPAVFRFEFSPSIDGMLDTPGYRIARLDGSAFAPVTTFLANGRRRIEIEPGEAGQPGLVMERRERNRDGQRYEAYGSTWQAQIQMPREASPIDPPGQVSFGPQQVITTAADRARSVYAADLDGDGDQDVLSASAFDDKIAWYENTGGRSFGPQQVITTGADGAQSVYAADLDGDGDQDVLSASAFDNKIAWYENERGGQFGSQQVITRQAAEAFSVYAADLDGDGDPDVLSASVFDNKIAWYENEGGGRFGPQQVITTEVDYAVDGRSTRRTSMGTATKMCSPRRSLATRLRGTRMRGAGSLAASR